MKGDIIGSIQHASTPLHKQNVIPKGSYHPKLLSDSERAILDSLQGKKRILIHCYIEKKQRILIHDRELLCGKQKGRILTVHDVEVEKRRLGGKIDDSRKGRRQIGTGRCPRTGRSAAGGVSSTTGAKLPESQWSVLDLSWARRTTKDSSRSSAQEARPLRGRGAGTTTGPGPGPFSCSASASAPMAAAAGGG